MIEYTEDYGDGTIGILLGVERFPGRKVLLVLNRTLIGMPPVVCGLLFYMLFCEDPRGDRARG